jgi:hypothetical protein
MSFDGFYLFSFFLSLSLFVLVVSYSNNHGNYECILFDIYRHKFAKSNRAKCKKCKETIVKDEIRIVVEIPGDSFHTTQSFHPTCFALPRKFSTGSNKLSTNDFFTDHVHDKSEGKILPSHIDELVQHVESKTSKNVSGGNQKVESNSVISNLKHKFQETMKESVDTGDLPPTKKVKKERKRDNDEDEIFKKQLELYGKFHNQFKNDEIKDILGYNRQTKTGTKDILLMKLIDGNTYGRLARCDVCGGRLKLKDDGNTVICSGTFDETRNLRMDCAFSCTAANAPRYQPWYVRMSLLFVR